MSNEENVTGVNTGTKTGTVLLLAAIVLIGAICGAIGFDATTTWKVGVATETSSYVFAKSAKETAVLKIDFKSNETILISPDAKCKGRESSARDWANLTATNSMGKSTSIRGLTACTDVGTRLTVASDITNTLSVISMGEYVHVYWKQVDIDGDWKVTSHSHLFETEDYHSAVKLLWSK